MLTFNCWQDGVPIWALYNPNTIIIPYRAQAEGHPPSNELYAEPGMGGFVAPWSGGAMSVVYELDGLPMRESADVGARLCSWPGPTPTAAPYPGP